MKLISTDAEKTIVEFNRDDWNRIGDVFMMLDEVTGHYDWPAAAVAENPVTKAEYSHFFRLWLALTKDEAAKAFLTRTSTKQQIH